ncbi:lasso peptide biosynthesis B2 protein [Luteimonas fraxinea]|uniref:Lasso peptide biosynthesis B2 protein n=1 Tax=Luteimonas fraxinea TaxID=2901869 RepID=A0ABS8UHA8_9GAMM|nr:lasso peptide biosynthesis B2 protein [Luteimonas fraxinea]MCD9098126.1 lasso peptide biosynthesis B2 protein [Luteimonas fraxinea]MCD9125344.1 lasso peptide biosynthesis B2 protein [Luteimonas fraxinea]UHH09149.1 lasso peptide biosynthesis B2 protein [Luteimonas fraxinea]
MTRYVLAHQISYCQVGSRLVFLDISRDRYFRLGKDLETALLAYFSGGAPDETCVGQLIQKGVLAEKFGSSTERRPLAPLPSQSAMEMAEIGTRTHVVEFLEVFLLVIHTRIRLRMTTLESVLDDYVRSEEIAGTPARCSMESTAQLLTTSAAFRRARLFVPVKMRCLVDSIALTRFLRRRRLRTRLVFGVALDPFSAHCWVQARDLVLNDTVGNVRCHTAIRSV